MKIQRIRVWLKDQWPFVVAGVLLAFGIIHGVFSIWANYECIRAGFIGGQLYNFNVVCFVLWH